MAHDVRDIWVYPKHGTTPDLTPLLDVTHIDEVFDAGADLQDLHLRNTETFAAQQAADLRGVQKDLAAKGVLFDVDRMLRRSLKDRVLDWWDNLMDRIRPEDHAEPYDPSDHHFEIVLAMTYPTNTLPFEYSEIDAETDRLKDAIAKEITARRGVAPHHLRIDTADLDDMDDDNWTDAQMFRADVAEFEMIWPPVEDRPGFALANRQDDGGLPIEIVLMTCDHAVYDRIVALS